MKRLMIAYASGSLGALASSLVLWWFERTGVTGVLGVDISPALPPDWLYFTIVWGGIFGILFLLPVFKTRFILKGSFLSLVPTAVMLLIAFPFKLHKGFLGLKLGFFTPLFVLFFNWIWGIVSATAIKIAR